MKKCAAKIVILFVMLLTLVGLMPSQAFAASITYYQTVEDNIILRTGPASSYNTNTKTVAKKGTVLKVVGKTTNSSGNLWYKLNDGYWVFSERVTKHSHYYVGGICSATGCGYEYPLSPTGVSMTARVTNQSGAKIWSRPYSNNSKHVATYAYGTEVSIVAKVTNVGTNGKPDNLWYKLSNGNWVYSGNVGQVFTVTYYANGGSGAPAAQKFVAGSSVTVSSTKPSRPGYAFKGWATSSSSSTVSYKGGSKYSTKKNLALYAVWKKCGHSAYYGGICTTCGYEYPLKETSYTGTFVVTNDNGAPVWSRPYSNNSKKVTTYDKDAKLQVVAKVTNIGTNGKADNLWYKLKDGSWVYSGNVTERYMVKYDANDGKNAPDTQYFLSGKSVKITSAKPTRVGYLFKGWATSKKSSWVSYEAGDKYSKTKNLTLYAIWKSCSHSYNSAGVCSKCSYVYKYKLDTSCAGSYVVVESNGALIRNTPYSVSGSKVRTAKKYEILTVKGKATNAHGNVWYQLSDGNWVYAERLESGYKVTYNANGGTGQPAATGFVSGKLVVSSTIPKKDQYVFMGWATSKTATKATYNVGDTYNVKKNITLYAVWTKCSHNYKNNYGICKTCKSEYPLTVKSSKQIVYSINNKNGTYTYKRPYSKSAEKVKKYANNKLVLVVGSATNANKEEWLKLKDGTWIKKSEVQKQTTYQTVDGVPYSCAKVMIGDSADGGLYRVESIGGVTYIKFFNSKKAFYLNASAFTGTSNNTQLADANAKLTEAVNSRTSLQKQITYNTKTTKTVKKLSYSCVYDNYETHNHVVWKISILTVKAGISGSDGVYTRCQNDAKTLTIEYCLDAKGIEEYWAHVSTIYPKFTVSTNPYVDDGEAVGWFTDYELLGNGYKTKNFEIEDYVDLFSSAVKGVTSVGKMIVSPTPKTVFNAIKDNWTFCSDVNSYTKSTAYTSEGKNSLTYIDKSTSTAYRTYKMSVRSPINLRSKKDYLEAHIYLYELNKNQNITVKLAIQ